MNCDGRYSYMIMHVLLFVFFLAFSVRLLAEPVFFFLAFENAIEFASGLTFELLIPRATVDGVSSSSVSIIAVMGGYCSVLLLLLLSLLLLLLTLSTAYIAFLLLRAGNSAFQEKRT